jgi:hypothetical protein
MLPKIFDAARALLVSVCKLIPPILVAVLAACSAPPVSPVSPAAPAQAVAPPIKVAPSPEARKQYAKIRRPNLDSGQGIFTVLFTE